MQSAGEKSCRLATERDFSLRELLEVREVIENPKGASVRGCDELAFTRVDCEVADLNAG